MTVALGGPDQIRQDAQSQTYVWDSNTMAWVKDTVVGGTTQATNIVQVGSAALAEGQTTMSASIPVAVASDQSPILVIAL